MGRTTLAVVLVTALTMLNDTVRGHVQQVTSYLWSAATAEPSTTAVVIATFFLLYVWQYFRANAVPVIIVPLDDDGSRDDEDISDSLAIKDAARPGYIQCFNPATGHFLGEVPVTTPAEVRDAIGRARAAQQVWAGTSWAERRRVMMMLNAAVIANADAICRVSTVDTGKTNVDGYLGEILTTCEKLRWVCADGEAALSPEERSVNMLLLPHKRARVEYHPLGVLGVIAPWNYPFHNLLNHIIAGLFSGNAVVSKPSEHSSWSGRYYLKLVRTVLKAAGHDPELVQIVTGFAETGAALVSGGVDKVIFTGSPAVGRHVMRGASASLTPVVLELGGKDPLVVCEDADLNTLVPVAMRAIYQSCGQNCIAPERFYVYDSVYDEFAERVTSHAKKLRQGPPSGRQGCDLGAMTMIGQAEMIQELVDDAVANGARLLNGGKLNTQGACARGQFFEPTILADVTQDMRIVKEEVFGPVMLLIRVPNDDDDVAIKMVNDSEFGLGSSVFTKDHARGDFLGKRIRAGMTCVNDYAVYYMAQSLPFGGVGVSGFGRFGGIEGLRECCLVKSVVTDRIPGMRAGLPPVLQYPVAPAATNFLRGLIGLVYGYSLGFRIRSLLRLIGAAVAPKPKTKKAKA